MPDHDPETPSTSTRWTLAIILLLAIGGAAVMLAMTYFSQ